MSREPPSQPLRGVAVLDLHDDKRMEPYDLATHQRDVGLRSFGWLVLERVADQDTMQRPPPAIE